MAHYHADDRRPRRHHGGLRLPGPLHSTAEWDPGVTEAEMLTPEPVGRRLRLPGGGLVRRPHAAAALRGHRVRAALPRHGAGRERLDHLRGHHHLRPPATTTGPHAHVTVTLRRHPPAQGRLPAVRAPILGPGLPPHRRPRRRWAPGRPAGPRRPARPAEPRRTRRRAPPTACVTLLRGGRAARRPLHDRLPLRAHRPAARAQGRGRVAGRPGRPRRLRGVGRPPPRSAARRRRRVDHARRLVDRLVAGDERGSWAIVQNALASGHRPRRRLPRRASPRPSRPSATSGPPARSPSARSTRPRWSSTGSSAGWGRCSPAAAASGAPSCSAPRRRPPRACPSRCSPTCCGARASPSSTSAPTRRSTSFVDAARARRPPGGGGHQRHRLRQRHGHRRGGRRAAGRGRHAPSCVGGGAMRRARGRRGSAPTAGAATAETRWRCSGGWPTMPAGPVAEPSAPGGPHDTPARPAARPGRRHRPRGHRRRSSFSRLGYDVPQPALRLERPHRAPDARQGRRGHRGHLRTRAGRRHPPGLARAPRSGCSAATSAAPSGPATRSWPTPATPTSRSAWPTSPGSTTCAATPSRSAATTTASTCWSTTPARSSASTELTVDGIELTAQTHVVAPFLLTAELLPLLGRHPGARVVTVSSGGMYTAAPRPRPPRRSAADDFDGVAAYARAKRAQVVLNRRVGRSGPRPSGVTFHAMHPGWVDTPGVQTALPDFARLMGPLLRTPDQGADTMVWLATAREPLERQRPVLARPPPPLDLQAAVDPHVGRRGRPPVGLGRRTGRRGRSRRPTHPVAAP